MPVQPFDPEHPAGGRPPRLRAATARCLSGRVTVALQLRPRFEYGTVLPRFTPTSPMTVAIVGGPDALWVRSSRPLGGDRGHGDGQLGSRGRGRGLGRGRVDRGRRALHRTTTPPSTPTPWRVASPRPSPSGRRGSPAAPTPATTSAGASRGARAEGAHLRAHGSRRRRRHHAFPEWLGGLRNWDYRFTWIRDATLTLASLACSGTSPRRPPSRAGWSAPAPADPRTCRSCTASPASGCCPSSSSRHLAGHRGSAPVRIGNGAAGQLQLDSLRAAARGRVPVRPGGRRAHASTTAHFLGQVADLTVRAWRRPDQGIWEIRDDPRHFVHSKLNCWMAPRPSACASPTPAGSPATSRGGRSERDAIAAWLLSEGAPDGWFLQAAGHPLADAATLLVPALGFLPPTHPKVLATIEVVRAT